MYTYSYIVILKTVRYLYLGHRVSNAVSWLLYFYRSLIIDYRLGCSEYTIHLNFIFISYLVVRLMDHSFVQGSDILYKDNILRAQEFLTKDLSPNLDAYTLGVISGALATARNSQSSLALQMMDKYANTSGKMTWYLCC